MRRNKRRQPRKALITHCRFSCEKHRSSLIDGRATFTIAKRYHETYCPIAHSLGLVGERWSLLVNDTTDLDAFRALARLELGVAVAVGSAEGPAELREAADLVVGSPAEFLEVLRAL